MMTLDWSGQNSQRVPDLRLCCGAGDENRTRTISLGIGQIMPADVADQPSGLTLSIRDWLHATLANCTLIARCRTLQGMARARSGQAAAWPLVSGPSVRSGLRGQART